MPFLHWFVILQFKILIPILAFCVVTLNVNLLTTTFVEKHKMKLIFSGNWVASVCFHFSHLNFSLWFFWTILLNGIAPSKFSKALWMSLSRYTKRFGTDLEIHLGKQSRQLLLQRLLPFDCYTWAALFIWRSTSLPKLYLAYLLL